MKRSYYCYISSLFLSQFNGVVSPSLLLIVMVCHIYFPPPHGWVSPLVGIDECIGRTFLRDHIIAILLYIIIILIGWIVWYQILVTFIPAQWCRITVPSIYCCFCRLYLFPHRGWVRPLVVITDCKASSLPRNHIIAIYHRFIYYPCRIEIIMSHYKVTKLLRNDASILYVSLVWLIMQYSII